MFAPPDVRLTVREDGSRLYHSTATLHPPARAVGDWLEHWARAAPERIFLAERDSPGEWRRVTYAHALRQARSIGAWLLSRGASPARPLVILSDNSIAHALAMLGALHVGVPSVSVSSSYSLASKDFARLGSIIRLAEPAVIMAGAADRFAAALGAIRPLHAATVVHGAVPALHDDSPVDRAFASITPDTIAKILFTSGSTNDPKGVINTQRMLCSNQQAIHQLWPFLDDAPPVVVDWLPWSHTFGANHNFNLVLRNGGTLCIDPGRPAPGLFDRSIALLRETAPTLYFNVPRGFDLLVPALRADEDLRRAFFSRLRLIFSAAAALPQNLWESLRELARSAAGREIPIVSAWGATETGPLATSCHFQAQRSGVIGVPIPGCDLKLVPVGDKLEIRVRGPNVTPGYWKRRELTAEAFDAEGFYCTGDAVRFVDDSNPKCGLLFDGRIAENFKLTTGTWVTVGQLRVRSVEALAPIASDVVIAGHDRDEAGLLIFPNLAACRALCTGADDPLADPRLKHHVARALARLKARGGGSSTCPTRAMLMAEPPSIDAGEITDKGYINQRRVLERRVAFVEKLYDPAAADVILPDAGHLS